MNSFREYIGEQRSVLAFIFLIVFQIVSAFVVFNIYFKMRLASEKRSAKTEFNLLTNQVQYSLNEGDYEGVVKFLSSFVKTYVSHCQYLSLKSRDGFKIYSFSAPEKSRHFFRQSKTLTYSFKGRAKLIYIVNLQSIYEKTYSFTAIIVGIFMITDFLLFVILRLSHSRKTALNRLKKREEELIDLNKSLAKEIERRKVIEKELRQKNKYLDLIQTAITEPFYIVNVSDYSIAMANKASGVVLDGSKKYCHWETHGNPQPCYDPEHPCPIEIIKQTKEPARVEHVHVDKLGNKKIYQIMGYPIFDESGNFVQMIEYNMDITERKEQEEELRKLKIGIESLEEAVFVTDKEGKITYFNPSFQKIYQFEPHEIIGKTPRILKSGVIPPEKYKKFWETILSNKPITGTIKNKRKDGSLVDVHSSVSPITNDSGEIVAFLAIQRDVTKELRMQEEIKKAKEAAEEADKMKAHFLAKISDEIEVPLKTFINYKDLLINKLKKLNDKDLLFIGDTLEKIAEKIKVNTELVLNYSEISIGNYSPVFSSLDIYEDVLLAIYLKFQKEAREKGLNLEMRHIATVSAVFVDEFSTRQIFLNLLDNAIKYTYEGGVTINIFNNTQKEVAVEIIDTGIGMDESELEKYLKPFETIEGESEVEIRGVGIGLPLVKKYCDLNRIELSFSSKKGEGTSVLLTFKRNI